MPNRRLVAGVLLSGVVHLAGAMLIVWPRAQLPAAAPHESRQIGGPVHDGPLVTNSSGDSGTKRPGESHPWHVAIDASLLSRWVSHLWQSTLVASGIWLLTLVCRRDRASVRYSLWLCASIKFFIPFSVLVGVGRALPWPDSAVALPGFVQTAVGQLGPAAAPAVLPGAASTMLPSSLSVWGPILFGVWLIGFAGVSLSRLSAWLRVRRVLRSSTVWEPRPLSWPAGIEVRSAAQLVEPGVVGFLRPVIVLPRGIGHQLTADQLRCVIAHEACHIRRRDNFTATLHMLIESTYWFHPVVWWIGSRLVYERERACDQAVLRAGAEPLTYARSIVIVCRRYVDAGLACVANAGGSHIKRRIEAIMRNDIGTRTSRWKVSLLATGGALTLALPIVAGALTAFPLNAQAPAAPREKTFDTVSIKRHPMSDPNRDFDAETDGRFSAVNMPVATLIGFAYDLPGFQVSGGPAWLAEDRFDVVATTSANASPFEKRSMMRRLLADRFQFVAHIDRVSQAGYTLVLAQGNGRVGPRLLRSAADCSNADPASAGPIGLLSAAAPRCGVLGFAAGTDFRARTGGLAFRGLTMAGLARKLAPIFGRGVADRTGLSGYFDADFDFIAEIPLPPPPPGEPRPAGATRVRSAWIVFPEQLGLRFDAGTIPVETLMIDRVDRPREN